MPTEREPPSLHSKYNPEREAVRFLDAQAITATPKYILVTEPGESYLAGALRARFPNSKLIAIRYQSVFFQSSDPLWDYVWRPDGLISFASFLFDLIPDEDIGLTLFLNWNPADAKWPEAASQIRAEIRSFLETQKSVMATRAYFGKRWFTNMIGNVVYAQSAYSPGHTDRPILLAAAGPSLERLQPFDREQFYVISVSAALSCLLSRGITPELCISTDGGHWALEHLRRIPSDVPLAFPIEAAIPREVLERNPLVSLSYGSALEGDLCALVGLRCESAERNGTISGTAAIYALNHTSSAVYVGGLDLCGSASFSHARPHAADQRLMDERLDPACSQLFRSNRETRSLDTYAAWFASNSGRFSGRLFRLEPAVRPIAGIASVAALPRIRAPGSNPSAWEAQPRHGDARSRAQKILEWLGGVENSVASIRSLEAFAQQVLSEGWDPILRDILQLVSYTNYCYLNRAAHEGQSRDAHEARLEALRSDFFSVSRSLAERFGRMR